jgi:hypothetical protein
VIRAISANVNDWDDRKTPRVDEVHVKTAYLVIAHHHGGPLTSVP